jgi:hypothetical protein
VTDRVEADGHERDGERPPCSEDEAPPPATRENGEREREERPEEATPGVRVRHEPDEDTGGHAMPDTVGPQAGDALEPEEQEDDEEWLRRRLDRHPPELEQPRRQPGEDDHDDRDERPSRQPKREHAQEQDRREHQHRRQPACDRLARPRQLEHPGEHVRVDGALVVVERPEEEREARAVLVAEPRGERVGVERERRLVAVVARRVGRRDPELERDDGEDRTEPEEQRRPVGERPHEAILEPQTEAEDLDTLRRCARSSPAAEASSDRISSSGSKARATTSSSRAAPTST